MIYDLICEQHLKRIKNSLESSQNRKKPQTLGDLNILPKVPPAQIWQNSNKLSKTGQSSPRLTEQRKTESQVSQFRKLKKGRRLRSTESSICVKQVHHGSYKPGKQLTLHLLYTTADLCQDDSVFSFYSFNYIHEGLNNI